MLVIGFILSSICQCGSKPQPSEEVSKGGKVVNYQLDSICYSSFDVTVLGKKVVKSAVDKKIASEIGMPRSSIKSKMGLTIATTDTVKLTQKEDSIYIYKDR